MGKGIREGVKMEIKKIKKFERDFIKLEILPVTQKAQTFYIGKLPAKEFLKLYTVEPAEYNIEKQIKIAEKFQDEDSYYKYLIQPSEKKIAKREFERKESKTRIKEIKKFLETEKYALFPNTIIVSCDLINNYLDNAPDTKFDTLGDSKEIFDERPNLSFLEKSKEGIYIYVPCVEKSILIIDGQHRVRGLELAEPKVSNDYELLISFIIDFDKSVLARLFYTINYTQKSVNKSLLYQLSGEFSYELTETKFMHESVKILNEIEKSPFYKRVKMLGTIPKDISKKDKQNMTVSQAFLIDYLVGTISEKKALSRSIYQPIFLYYYKKEKEQIEIIRFLIKYFNAIKQIRKKDWNNPEKSIICKTIGVGAFIRVLYFLYIKMFIHEFKSDPQKIKDIKMEDLIEKLKGIEKVNFDKTGEFGGVGSAGSLNKLMEKLIESISYFEIDKYKEFLKIYKVKYLNPFKDWLKGQIKS